MYNGSKTRRDIPPQYPIESVRELQNFPAGEDGSTRRGYIVGHANISIQITPNPQIKVEIAYKYWYPPGGPSDPHTGVRPSMMGRLQAP